MSGAGYLPVELSTQTMRVIVKTISKTFNIPRKEIPRVLFHGIILAFIIAGFWLIDSLKDPILTNTIGIEYQPLAKLLSVVATFFVVCIYDFLTSKVSKPALFHIISAVFSLVVMVFAALLSDPSSGIGRKDIGPHRILGWCTYFTIEAYGSLMVALFWSFTNSVMNLEQAKGAYGLIIAIAQIGAIIGSTFAANAATLTIPTLFIIGSLLIASVSLLIKTYHLTFRDEITRAVKTSRVRSTSENIMIDPLLPTTAQPLPHTHSTSLSITPHVSTSTSESPYSLHCLLHQYLYPCGQSVFSVFSGFYEGLLLIYQHPYVFKLLIVSCLYEIVVTILDYEFKLMASMHAFDQVVTHSSSSISGSSISGDTGMDMLSTDPATNTAHQAIQLYHESASNEFANLLGHFGQLTNLISFTLSFFGFSYFVHVIGVPNSLLIFPVTLLFTVIITTFYPTIWMMFTCVSLLKGMIFSLHDPVKELLYLPTSESIKFKAKAWIDVFGSRLAKAVGSLITNMAMGNLIRLRGLSELPALLLTIIVIAITYSIGQDFHGLVRTQKIVGEEDEGVSMANRKMIFGGVKHARRRGSGRNSRGRDSNDSRGSSSGDSRRNTNHGGQEERGRYPASMWTVPIENTVRTTEDDENEENAENENAEDAASSSDSDSDSEEEEGSSERNNSRGHSRKRGPVIHGLRPGQVGYAGYDLHLFEGVFDDATDYELIQEEAGKHRYEARYMRMYHQQQRFQQQQQEMLHQQQQQLQLQGEVYDTLPSPASSVEEEEEEIVFDDFLQGIPATIPPHAPVTSTPILMTALSSSGTTRTAPSRKSFQSLSLPST